MGHHIDAFVGKPDSIQELLSPIEYHSQYRYDLPQGFQLLLNDCDPFLDLASAYVEKHTKLSENPVDWMIQYAELTCKTGMVGFIKTDYFAGIGNQSAILIRQGKTDVFWYDDTESMKFDQTSIYSQALTSFPINKVLRKIGVKKMGGDEFDSINLSGYRHMPSY